MLGNQSTEVLLQSQVVKNRGDKNSVTRGSGYKGRYQSAFTEITTFKTEKLNFRY